MATSQSYPAPGSFKARIAKAATQLHVAIYRASRGRLGKKYKGGPVVLVDHIGRKSGRKRTAPLLYQKDGDKIILVASAGGADFMPAWWLNLKAHPQTTAQIGAIHYKVSARLGTPEEKVRYWPQMVAMYPDYDVYQTRTDREIPIVVLAVEE